MILDRTRASSTRYPCASMATRPCHRGRAVIHRSHLVSGCRRRYVKNHRRPQAFCCRRRPSSSRRPHATRLRRRHVEPSPDIPILSPSSTGGPAAHLVSIIVATSRTAVESPSSACIWHSSSPSSRCTSACTLGHQAARYRN
jgi:hypothetical protein